MKPTKANQCVEDNQWTAVPVDPPAALSDFTLRLSDVDHSENERIKESGVMTFHMAGCAGDFLHHNYQQAVADAMAAQVNSPGSVGVPGGPATNASFFFHLGDVVYKPDKADKKISGKETADQRQMYNAQFYVPYTGYHRSIFAIAGNHDGKNSPPDDTSAIHHFLLNFCSPQRTLSPDNQTDGRLAMNQPYVYWRLDTPLAYIIGLYSNIANGGILDDPTRHPKGPQYQWLVEQLKQVKEENVSNPARKAVLLAMHYPPYSGAANFKERGDPTLGPTPGVENARPFSDLLQDAFTESGQRPDAVFSAHAHLYQRLKYCYHDDWEVPYLIAGCGGHFPIESMGEMCNGDPGLTQTPPFPAVMPNGFPLPYGDEVQVVACNDLSFGFLRVTIASNKLTGEFFAVIEGSLTRNDAFELDMDKHKVIEIVP